ncbi:MAG: hypothetical protein RL207_387 [Bacteroidota bacterium]
MRLLYFVFNIFLGYSLRMFFRKIRLVNATKSRFSSTIFVSNHPSAFMDPLVVSVLRKPIVFFMTRSDVFTKFSKPFLRSAHMIPIYRQHDGGNSTEKNIESFRKATEVLSGNRSLLIFGEGMTDDVFERRMKPLKKGALRIGFTALEGTNWKKEIRLVAVGCNYTNPNVMRSDLLIAESNPIILNDYKDQYLENPTKTINELNRMLESALISVITHIKSENDFAFHEQVMMLTRKGMNPTCFDDHYSLQQRWSYSKDLAHFLNQYEGNLPSEIEGLKSELSLYFQRLASNGLTEKELYDNHERHALMLFLKVVLLSPFAFLGMIHAFIPYYFVKRFVEKTFKRQVFWNSTKMVITMLAMQLLNLPLLFILPELLGVEFWIAFVYYLSIGLLGLAWYQSRKMIQHLIAAKDSSKSRIVTEMWSERQALLQRIQELIPVNIS